MWGWFSEGALSNRDAQFSCHVRALTSTVAVLRPAQQGGARQSVAAHAFAAKTRQNDHRAAANVCVFRFPSQVGNYMLSGLFSKGLELAMRTARISVCTRTYGIRKQHLLSTWQHLEAARPLLLLLLGALLLCLAVLITAQASAPSYSTGTSTVLGLTSTNTSTGTPSIIISHHTVNAPRRQLPEHHVTGDGHDIAPRPYGTYRTIRVPYSISRCHHPGSHYCHAVVIRDLILPSYCTSLWAQVRGAYSTADTAGGRG